MAIVAALDGRDAPCFTADLRDDVASRLGYAVNRGALARALGELVRDRLIHERQAAHSEHGGPARKLYAIAPAGRAAILGAIHAFVRLTSRRKLSPLAAAFLQNPPRASKTAAAVRYGVDLNRLSRTLYQSPQERFRVALASMRSLSKFAR